MDGTASLFPIEHHPALAAHLSANVEHDPATGCLLWQGYRNREHGALSIAEMRCAATRRAVGYGLRVAG